MTADRHKHKPVRFRPSEANRERITEQAAETGKAVNAILNEALDVFWQVTGRGPTASPTGRKPAAPAVGPPDPESAPPAAAQRRAAARLADPKLRKKPDDVVDAALAEQDAVPLVPLVREDEPAPKTGTKPRAKGPCEHRVKLGAYCRRCERMI